MKAVLPYNLIQFLIRRQWVFKEKDATFFHFSPPIGSNLPEGFELMVPKSIGSSQYNRFIENTVDIIYQISDMEYRNQDDLLNILKGKSALLSLRVIDPDTADGTINFLNFNKQIDKLHELIKEAVGFSLTNQQYFVNTPKNIAEDYLGTCRGLQTAVGSFVTKIRLPYGGVMDFVVDKLDTSDVISKIDTTYDFILNDVVNTAVEQIDASYMQQHRNVFSIQVVEKVQQLYSQSHINNSELSLSTIRFDRTYQTKNFLKTVKHLQAFTRRAKKVLMQSIPLSARGKVIRLNSKNPEAVAGHKVLIRSEINNSIVAINATLSRDDYRKAIQAHEFHRTVYITGFAKELANSFHLDNVETFSIE